MHHNCLYSVCVYLFPNTNKQSSWKGVSSNSPNEDWQVAVGATASYNPSQDTREMTMQISGHVWELKQGVSTTLFTSRWYQKSDLGEITEEKGGLKIICEGMEGMDGVRDKRKVFHTRTQEKVPEVCGKGCGGYYWKELVSPYLKTKGMLENCVGKQKPWGPGANQGEHTREHAHRGKDEGQGLHQGCKYSENRQCAW